MIRYKDQQRPADHDEALRILRRLEQRRPRDIERTKDLFSTFVDPAINYMPNPTSAQVNAVNCSFTEWCFYDFVLEPDPSGTPFAGTTVLEDAAAEDPSLKQLADTQFFSSFWVIEQDREHGLSLLREQSTCQDFIVHDPMIAGRELWATGTLNARLSFADGIWQTCGRCISHDQHVTDPLPQRIGEFTPLRNDRARFILLTRELQGIDGRYLESMNAENIFPQTA